MADPACLGGARQEVTSVERLSKQATRRKPSDIRKFFESAATMKDAISLGIGKPDFRMPKPILEVPFWLPDQKGTYPVSLLRSLFCSYFSY
jgi:hypothetical protein